MVMRGGWMPISPPFHQIRPCIRVRATSSRSRGDGCRGGNGEHRIERTSKGGATKQTDPAKDRKKAAGCERTRRSSWAEKRARNHARCGKGTDKWSRRIMRLDVVQGTSGESLRKLGNINAKSLDTRASKAL